MGRQAWWLACTIILFSPITLITAHPSIILIFDTICLATCLLTISSESIIVDKRFILSLISPFLLISLYFTFQAVPLSPEMLKMLVPEIWQNYQDTIWKLEPGVWMPLSSQVEATVYAWLHLCSLWAICFAFSSLIDSHWRLFQLLRVFAMGASVWSVLIIMTSVYKVFPWWIFRAIENYQYQFSVVLGFWVAIFSPVLFAGNESFKSCGTISRSFIRIFKKPEKSPHAAVLLGLSLSFLSLLLLFTPVLWFTVLTGYLLFRSLRSIQVDEHHSAHKRFVHAFTCICVISLVVWISLTSTIHQDLEPLSHANVTDGYFSWFGHGLALNYVKNITGEGVSEAVLGGGLIEIWTGLGFIGTFLLVVAILAIYHGSGGRKGLNKLDQITSSLHSGGVAGLVTLLITGSFVSFWRWQSMSAAIIYLTIFVTCCRRVSNLMAEKKKGGVSRPTVLTLKLSVCCLLSMCILLVVLRAGAGLLAEHTVYQPLEINDSTLKKDDFNLRDKVLSTIMLFNSGLSLDQGTRYLIQKRDRDARLAIMSAFRLQPLSPQAHIAVASLSACIGDETTAMAFFSTDIAKNYVPDSSTELLVARLLGVTESAAGIKLINLVLEHSPQLASLYLNLMTLYGYEALTLKSFFPKHPQVMLALGDLLISKGYNEEAEDAYWSAVYNKNDEFAQDENFYLHIAKYFATTDRLSEAIIITKEGIKAYPDSRNLKKLLKNFGADLKQ